MVKIFGITIFGKTTDAELVERTRENLRWCRRVAWIKLLVFAGFAILIPKFYTFFKEFIGDMPKC